MHPDMRVGGHLAQYVRTLQVGKGGLEFAAGFGARRCIEFALQVRADMRMEGWHRWLLRSVREESILRSEPKRYLYATAAFAALSFK
jgi:hypothetical protein